MNRIDFNFSAQIKEEKETNKKSSSNYSAIDSIPKVDEAVANLEESSDTDDESDEVLNNQEIDEKVNIKVLFLTKSFCLFFSFFQLLANFLQCCKKL